MKETAGVLSNKHWTGRPRKTTAADDRNIVWAVKKNPKTNNLHRAGVKESQSTLRRRLREQVYRGYTTRWKPLISCNIGRWDSNLKRSVSHKRKKLMSHKRSGTKFYVLLRPRLPSARVMERLQNIEAHLRGTVEKVSWLVLARLLLEWAHYITLHYYILGIWQTVLSRVTYNKVQSAYL